MNRKKRGLVILEDDISWFAGQVAREFSTSIEIPYTEERMAAQTIALPVHTQRRTLIVTVCALKYRLTEHGEKLVSKNPA